MPWYVLFGLLSLLPVFLIGLVYLTVRLRKPFEARRTRLEVPEPPELPGRVEDGVLRPHSVALEAQFLLAPARAIREAEEQLSAVDGSTLLRACESLTSREAMRLRFEEVILRVEALEGAPTTPVPSKQLDATDE